jgi:long-chain acyl-CoA synthetase
MTIKRVFDVIKYQQEKYPQNNALNYFVEGAWEGQSISEVAHRVDAISVWLIENGYKKDDKIAIVPILGHPDWMVFDFACQQIGVITVPIHPTTNDAEIDFILTQTDAKLCLTADTGLYYKLKTILQKSQNTVELFHIDTDSSGYFEPLSFKKPNKMQAESLELLKNQIKEDDILTIMYTSGTSGVPKGAVLTHRNLVSNIRAGMSIFPLGASERVLSFLPFSHILEKSVCYTYMACGVSIFFSRDKDSFTHDFQTVRPSFCTAVPRILEKLYGYVQKELMGKNPVKRLLIKHVLTVAKNYDPSVSKGILSKIHLFLLQILVLNRWRNQLGGKIRCIAVGAASLKPEISRFFYAAKINVCEGYGLTETSPLIAINRFERGLNRFGTVGLPLPHVEVKIDAPKEEEGEIWVKGPNVMREYYKNPELTEGAFTPDGWFKTGDVGTWVEDKFLKITDRKKDIFKTSAGKYIAPQQLEKHIRSSPFIQQCLIIGFNKPYITALIVPDFALLQNWCDREAIHWTSPEYMVHNIKVRAMFQKEITKLNKELPNNERVRDFVLCEKEWTSETGEMTTSFKPLRDILQKNYMKEIEKMYLKEM